MLLGKQEERHAILRPAEFYQTQRIELVTGKRIASLDELPPQDWVILATGARNRVLRGFEDALYVRTLGESLALPSSVPFLVFAAAGAAVTLRGGFNFGTRPAGGDGAGDAAPGETGLSRHGPVR